MATPEQPRALSPIDEVWAQFTPHPDQGGIDAGPPSTWTVESVAAAQEAQAAPQATRLARFKAYVAQVVESLGEAAANGPHHL